MEKKYVNGKTGQIDIEDSHKEKLEELKELWNQLGNIPINENEEIDEDFHIWKKGTDKFYIWDWFDEVLPNGLMRGPLYTS